MSSRILLAVVIVQTAVLAFVLGLLAPRPGAAAPAPAPQTQAAPPASQQIIDQQGDQVRAANAQEQPVMPATLSVSLAEARVILDAAVAYAKGVNGAAGIAVLDSAGNVVSLDRMDGASYHQDRQSAGKARIAVQLRQRSSATTRILETAPERFYSVLSMFPGEILWQSGGVPLAVDGRLVGAVGVSGLPSGQDERAADAGVDAWQLYRPNIAP
jgi:glc operon protein GlcG